LGVYLDIRFFDVMQQRFGVGGSFAEAYVVAHEMGHHVQNTLGLTARVANAERINPSQSNGLSVGVELQADCYAGVWAHSTYQRQLLEPGDLDQALNAAAAVGDDFQQKAATGQISPEQWTHGSSAQRQAWLTKGFDSGDPATCNTFAA
jgi:predicted metalloprotease